MTMHIAPEAIIDYLHKALPADEDALVFLHLESCSSCRDMHTREIELSEIIASRAAFEEREMPESLRMSIRAAVATKPNRLAEFFRPRSIRFGLPAGAAFALALIAGPSYLGHSAVQSPPQLIEATAYFDHHADAALRMPLADRAGALHLDQSPELADDMQNSDNADSQ